MTAVEQGGGMSPEQQREYVARCIAATKDLGIGRGASTALLAAHFVREMGIDKAVAANALRIQVSTLADQMFLARSVSPQTRDKFEESIRERDEKKEPAPQLSHKQPDKHRRKKGGGRPQGSFNPRPFQPTRPRIPTDRTHGPMAVLVREAAPPVDDTYFNVSPFAALSRIFEEKPPTSYVAEPEPEAIIQPEAVTETPVVIEARSEVQPSMTAEPALPVVVDNPGVAETQAAVVETGIVYQAPSPEPRLAVQEDERPVTLLPDLPDWYKKAAYLKSIGAKPNVIEAVCKQDYAAVQISLRMAKEYPSRLGSASYEEIEEELRSNPKIARLLDLVIESNKPRDPGSPPVVIPASLISELKGKTVRYTQPVEAKPIIGQRRRSSVTVSATEPEVKEKAPLSEARRAALEMAWAARSRHAAARRAMAPLASIQRTDSEARKIEIVRKNPHARFVGRPNPRVEQARQEALRLLTASKL